MSAHIISPAMDRIIGFMLGFFALLGGVVITAFGMYIWASLGSVETTPVRRAHARAVTMASLWGLLAVFLANLLLILLFAAVLGATSVTA